MFAYKLMSVKFNRAKKPKLLLKKNTALWIELLKSISRTGHTSGPTSQHYIQGYQSVFVKWGILKRGTIDLNLIDRLVRTYDETGCLPDFKP